jgi:ABC-type dipeptide/oligopeptide/nickel transport system ATPase component
VAAPLLTVKNLCVEYRGDGVQVDAVSDVGFDLPVSSTLGIIGGSGAGKSSIAKALAGLLDTSSTRVSGEVTFEGNDILAMSESEWDQLRGSRIGMIFQDPRGSLDPTMRVTNQLAEAIRLHKNTSRSESKREAIHRLADVGIDEELLGAAPYAHQLSTGLCQRAMIAIALAGGPSLLIADEPTGALDVTTQARIIALLKQKQLDFSLSIIFITHDLALAARFADRLLVMREGIAVESGSVDAILHEPKQDYTRELVWTWKEAFAHGGIADAPD